MVSYFESSVVVTSIFSETAEDPLAISKSWFDVFFTSKEMIALYDDGAKSSTSVSVSVRASAKHLPLGVLSLLSSEQLESTSMIRTGKNSFLIMAF